MEIREITYEEKLKQKVYGNVSIAGCKSCGSIIFVNHNEIAPVEKNVPFLELMDKKAPCCEKPNYFYGKKLIWR